MSKYFEENMLIEHLTKMLVTSAVNNTGYKTYASNVFRDIAVNRLSVWLEFAPTADVVEVKHGKNISDSGFLCSVCSFGDFGGFHGYEPNYCPNCGAKMDESEDEDE